MAADPNMAGRRRAQVIYVSKALGRRFRWGVPDLVGRFKGESLVAPRSLAFVGGGDFERTGREYMEFFQSLGGLGADQRVLDVGCGIGRMAIPLLDFLEGGSYAGFDVGREMIAWCRRHITARRPEFEFTWAPVYNRKYNPFGTVPGSRFHFPYDDSSFDFAFATSLFTHLTAADASHYLSEIGRVLRPGGRCLLTFFILHQASLAEIEANRASFQFRYPVAGGRTIDQHEPEAAIAFDLAVLTRMFEEAGLEISPPIHHGLWANAPDGLAGQDIVVAVAGSGGSAAAP